MQLDFFKVVTILYALVGIPLMFIYMANIGTILATSFKYSYSKMCRYKIFSGPNHFQQMCGERFKIRGAGRGGPKEKMS